MYAFIKTYIRISIRGWKRPPTTGFQADILDLQPLEMSNQQPS